MIQKKLQIMGMLLILPFLLFAEVEWRTNLADALGEASITRQNIFVIITAPSWCGPCQYMEENVFPDHTVIDVLNSRFIPLQVLDEVNGRSNPDLGKFDFAGFPTYLVMDPNKKVLVQDSGAVDASTLLALIEPYFSYNGFVPESNPETNGEANPEAGMISGAYARDGGEKAYFFSQNEYMLYDINKDRRDPGFPQDVDYDTWPGLTFSKIDAALNWGNGKIYFFSGNKYIRYDVARNSADSGYPKSINNSTWPGLTFTSVDAAVNGGNGKAYFFSGSKYVQYDIRSDRSDFSSPKEISTFWRDVPFYSIDAALSYGNLIHLYSGNETIAFNLSRGAAISRTPSPVNIWR
ncbi:MAG: thioredoxin family protein [Spirochaetales bacterium]|nr:thioredoxin family protein [Spirochaetales bacterium]